jgi:hypothetical protein
MLGDALEIIHNLFDDQGAAQKKEPANGKAQPFLTTGGEAEPKRNSCYERKQEVVGCYTDSPQNGRRKVW